MINPYIANSTTIISIVDESANTKTFTLRFKDKELRETFSFSPGQFVQVSIPKFGEAPVSLSSSPIEKDLELCVRRAGNVTGALHRLKVNDTVWVRGPYGRGFPFDEIKGRKIVFVAGGIGLSPLRSVINNVLAHKDEFNEIQILYGDRAPDCLLFQEDFEAWQRVFEVVTICERGGDGWTGPIGLITKLFDIVEISPTNSVAMICGPPVMYKFVTEKLLELKFAEKNIFLSFERRMKCGVGNCRHCNIGPKFACLDGPVFSLEEAKDLHEALTYGK